MPFMAAYAPSKCYLLSLTQAADHELRPLGIRMLALCPGPTRTDFFARSGVADSATNFVFQRPQQVVRVGLRAIETGKTVSVWMAEPHNRAWWSPRTVRNLIAHREVPDGPLMQRDAADSRPSG
jgi:short-subunit dehydrogenase